MNILQAAEFLTDKMTSEVRFMKTLRGVVTEAFEDTNLQEMSMNYIAYIDRRIEMFETSSSKMQEMIMEEDVDSLKQVLQVYSE